MSLLSLFGISAQDRDPLSGFWYGPVGRKTLAGVDVNENTAMNYSGSWACTRLLCATGSSVPLNLMETLGPQEREIAVDHNVQRILHGEFNPETGSTLGRAFGINMQVNWGNFIAEIVREFGTEGPIKYLYPIHTSRVSKARYDDGTLGYRVKNDDNTTDDFTKEEIFHVPSIISVDGTWGKGVIQNARESIGAAIGTEKHGASYFGNGAMPGVIIKGGKFKSKEEREDYRRQWMEVHGGPEKALKPAILPPEADVAFMTFNARDSQFLELREHNINEMCRWYGVPPHMVYDLRRATYTNIEYQGIDFVVYSMLAWWKLWEEEIWRKLLTAEEKKRYFAKHSVEGLLRGDSAARAAFYKALFEIGVLSVNDILELEDRNGVGPDGDKRFVPLNFTTLEKAGTEPIAKPPAATVAPLDASKEALAKLVDYVAARPDEKISGGCRQLIAATVSRMLAKECRACEAAAKNNRQPKAFFAWLDEYYDRYAATLADATVKQIEISLLADGDKREPAEVARASAAAHVARSKEDILQATEVAEGQWSTVPQRIAACGERWQAERPTEFLGA